jgi:predicted Zn finger-like uncharacterized protein
MKISCQSCQSKYNVADEKVQGKIVKIRCRKCGATIVVDGNAGAGTNGSAAAQAAAPDAGGEAGGDGQWHVNVSETDQRTMSLAELVEAYNASVVTQDTFIWTDGMDDWRPLGEVDAVVAALHAAAAGDGDGAQAAAETGGGDAATQAFSYDAAAYGSSYGQAAQAPVMEAAAAEPAPEPRRAAVKREARSRDLFGEGGGGDEVQTSAPSMAHAQSAARAAPPVMDDAASKMTGERNENSVLFSLAVLTQATGPAERPSAGATTAMKDDSGLIDLKALAAKTTSTRPVAPRAEAPDAFAAPLGFAPPLAPLGAMSTPPGEEAKSKLPLLIGGGVGVLLLLIVGVVIGVKIAAGPAPMPSASVAPPPPSASAEPAPSATAEAAPSAAPSASVAAAPKPKPVVHAGGGGGGAPKPATAGGGAGGGTTPAPAPTAVQTAAPKKNDCGCNGDLMCLMKCSTH